MQEYFKIIVFLLKHLLQSEKPLFDNPKKIEIYISDNIRHTKVCWSPSSGAYFVDNLFKEDKK